MADDLPTLIAQVDEAQAALVAMVTADLEAEVATQVDRILARGEHLTEVMTALGLATERLVQHCRVHGVPADLAERASAWQVEIATLLKALVIKTEDVDAHRSLVRETLVKLNQASTGLEGYRQKSEKKPPRFITKEA